jgi:hypothetical protein
MYRNRAMGPISIALDEDAMHTDNVPTSLFVLFFSAIIRDYGIHNKK